jgi:amidase
VTASDGDGDPAWWDARTVAAAIAGRRLSTREYLAALHARISAIKPILNAVVTLDENAFRAAADADEAVVRGAPLGPLQGVCMTLKDSLCTAGLRTTGGTPDFADHVQQEDAHVVAALRRAGAIVVGKTNVPPYAADVQTDGDLLGPARNPWNPAFTPGGSSGGAAAAVAAGLSPVELGSDVAGSIRIPAAACGILGHRPSYGTVSMHGHVPYPRKLTAPDMAVIGPLARSVGDLELLLDVISGPGPDEQRAWRLELPRPRTLRSVAVVPQDPFCPVDERVAAAVRLAGEVLRADGVAVLEGTFGELGLGIDLNESHTVFLRLLTAAASTGYSAADVEDIAAGLRPAGDELGSRYVAQRHRDWLRAREQRAGLRHRWAEFFRRFDAVVLPVAPNVVSELDARPFAERSIVVDGHARSYWDQIVWAGLTGVSDLPSTAVPVKLDERGLPLGVAVCGAYLEDRTALAVADRIARLLPVLPHPPTARPPPPADRPTRPA